MIGKCGTECAYSSILMPCSRSVFLKISERRFMAKSCSVANDSAPARRFRGFRLVEGLEVSKCNGSRSLTQCSHGKFLRIRAFVGIKWRAFSHCSVSSGEGGQRRNRIPDLCSQNRYPVARGSLRQRGERTVSQ